MNVTKKFEFDLSILGEAQLKEEPREEHDFGNIKIVDWNGIPYKPIRELTKLKLFRVRLLVPPKRTKRF